MRFLSEGNINENRQRQKTLTPKEWRMLFLGVTLLFGIITRFFPWLQAGFPLNDGGMFLSMIRDLRGSHYSLPALISYNNLTIPYAYSPFGFYFARLISDLFNFSEITLLRWLPPIINTLSILAFYMLVSLLLGSRRRAVVASIFYALTPGASAWFIMGGGLTRSFGSLFMLISLYWVFRLFRDGGNRELALSIVFCSLTVLSHPEVGIHTAASCILLWLIYGHSLRTALHSVIVLFACLLLSAPWWAGVFSYHGLAPFLSSPAKQLSRSFLSHVCLEYFGVCGGKNTSWSDHPSLPYRAAQRAKYCLLPILYVDGARSYRCAPRFC